MRRIPLSRAAQLLPRIALLAHIGAPIERGLERSNLTPLLREDPDMLISAHANAAFTWDMARREGIEDFGWRASSSQLHEMRPDLVRRLHCSPTLLHALRGLCSLAHRESSALSMWLEKRGGALFLCHRSPIGLGAPGADELTMMRTALSLSIVRIFTAPDWVPTECGFAVEGEIGPLVRENLGEARILRTPNYGWVRLPRSILARPPRTPVRMETRADTDGGEEPALDLLGSLVQLVRPYLAEAAPSINGFTGKVIALEREEEKAVGNV